MINVPCGCFTDVCVWWYYQGNDVRLSYPRAGGCIMTEKARTPAGRPPQKVFLKREQAVYEANLSQTTVQSGIDAGGKR
jgi:hypothetical protein